MRTKSAVTLIGCLAALAAAPSLAADLNVLRDVRLEPTASGARVVVTGSRPPVFTVFRLAGPDRLVIDVASADATAVRGARDGQGPIAGINVSQFTDSTLQRRPGAGHAPRGEELRREGGREPARRLGGGRGRSARAPWPALRPPPRPPRRRAARRPRPSPRLPPLAAEPAAAPAQAAAASAPDVVIGGPRVPPGEDPGPPPHRGRVPGRHPAALLRRRGARLRASPPHRTRAGSRWTSPG